ncbi:hypothetical protein RJ639_047606 [Escallonia herrerae]|uniref:FAM192A/Fyv6 N-terminal domain-containing protein n=1 Tax=Escallonia herrerae TaxID=1293975 RepID=A0AA88WAQ9_9ASTE|nr:hypothetical protein RJ639_047606 [Escallonia herrerae]
MADANSPPPIRLMNFVSQDQLDEAKRNRGARVEDGTAQRDRSLYEVLKENKDKKDAEFNERFKHRPPKALDDDETEFLDKLELSRREYERQMADEEAQQLQSFQAAVAAQSTMVNELKDTPPVPRVEIAHERLTALKCCKYALVLPPWRSDSKVRHPEIKYVRTVHPSQEFRSGASLCGFMCIGAQRLDVDGVESMFCHSMLNGPAFCKFCTCYDQKFVRRKNPPPCALGMTIKVKPQAKKAKLDRGNSKESLEVVRTPNPDIGKHAGSIKTACSDSKDSNVVGNSSLVSYSDESEDESEHV